MQDTVDPSSAETAEIERHKYFLSEKAGHDVGWNHAAQDWEQHYGAAFRRDAGHVTPTNGISLLFRRLFSKG